MGREIRALNGKLSLGRELWDLNGKEMTQGQK